MSETKEQPELAQVASASPLPIPTNVSSASLNSSYVGSTPSCSNGMSINASSHFRSYTESPVPPEPPKLPAAIPIRPETQATPTSISF